MLDIFVDVKFLTANDFAYLATARISQYAFASRKTAHGVAPHKEIYHG